MIPEGTQFFQTKLVFESRMSLVLKHRQGVCPNKTAPALIVIDCSGAGLATMSWKSGEAFGRHRFSAKPLGSL